MPDDSLHQPHDKLFRATFSNPENAAAFLRHHLDAPLPALVDWNSLSLLPGSFIDSKMAGSEADLLFSARIGGSDALLYLLWEHQRTDAPLMGLRLLSYMVRIWKRQVRESGPSARLAPILPLVLAQDKATGKPPRISTTCSHSRRKTGTPSAPVLGFRFPPTPTGGPALRRHPRHTRRHPDPRQP